MKNRCPYCNRADCVRYVLFANVENYGSSGGTIPCIHCGKIISVYAERTVVIHSISKSDKTRDEADW